MPMESPLVDARSWWKFFCVNGRIRRPDRHYSQGKCLNVPDRAPRTEGSNRMDDWPDFKSIADLEEHYKRLLLAAQGRLKRSWWGKESQKQAADFVHDAFQKAMSGQRNWDRTRSLYQNLW